MTPASQRWRGNR